MMVLQWSSPGLKPNICTGTFRSKEFGRSVTYCRHRSGRASRFRSPSAAVCSQSAGHHFTVCFVLSELPKEQVWTHRDNYTICPGTEHLSAKTHAQPGRGRVFCLLSITADEKAALVLPYNLMLNHIIFKSNVAKWPH